MFHQLYSFTGSFSCSFFLPFILWSDCSASHSLQSCRVDSLRLPFLLTNLIELFKRTLSSWKEYIFKNKIFFSFLSSKWHLKLYISGEKKINKICKGLIFLSLIMPLVSFCTFQARQPKFIICF